MTGISNSAGLPRLALIRAMRRAWRNLALFRSWLASAGARMPSQLTMVPQDLRTADPTVAADIYAGHFVFAGQSVSTDGQMPFDVPPPSRAWAEALHGMTWLRHLRAADTALAKANARTLVDDLIRSGHDRDEVARQPAIAARRLVAMLAHAGIVTEGADHGFYHRFIRHLGQTARRLSVDMRHGLTERDRLAAAIGCAYAGLCLDRMEGLAKSATRRLALELDWQILPDGGHVSRNPRILLELLLDLLPLRGIYAAKGLEPPRALTGAIDRMMPQIRMFRHGDGALALFNGMGTTPPDTLATLLAYDDARARPMTDAPYSGYVRIEAGSSLLVADVGAGPDVWSSAEAGAAPMAFEFSSGRQRLIVNCGAPLNGSGELRLASRSTAAHSTLVINDTSAGHFAGIGGETLLVEGASKVVFQRRAEIPGSVGPVLSASHDGYVHSFGLVHERRLSLSAGGQTLAGEDRLSGEAAPAVPAVLRFHLHPAVNATLLQDGNAALLVANGQPGAGQAAHAHEGWLFRCDDSRVTLEDSLFMADPHGPRRTLQIVIAFDAAAGAAIAWRLDRVELQKRKPAGAVKTPPQLL